MRIGGLRVLCLIKIRILEVSRQRLKSEAMMKRSISPSYPNWPRIRLLVIPPVSKPRRWWFLLRKTGNVSQQQQQQQQLSANLQQRQAMPQIPAIHLSTPQRNLLLLLLLNQATTFPQYLQSTSPPSSGP